MIFSFCRIATAPGNYFNYSSSLTTSSPKYCRCDKKCHGQPEFYYEALQVNVTINGSYRFLSSGTMKTHVDIYKNNFNKSNPGQNLIHPIDDSSEENQFKLEVRLFAGNKYILVVTTEKRNITGKFSVTAIGSGLVTLHSLQQ